jgi:hypothetical protein
LASIKFRFLSSPQHLGLILGDQSKASALVEHFGSIQQLSRAAVVLRQERQQLTLDNPLAIADLCSEMRFLDREVLKVVLLNAKPGSAQETEIYVRVAVPEIIPLKKMLQNSTAACKTLHPMV